MALPTGAITSTDDFSPMYLGDTKQAFAPQFWTWSESQGKYIPLDITGLTISMVMVNADSQTNVCSGTWTIDNASQGQAHYQWLQNDVNTVGQWTLFIKLTDGLGKVVHADTKLLTIKYAP